MIMKRGLTALSLVILAGAGMTADSQLNEIKARYRELDKAIAKKEKIRTFLTQDVNEKHSYDEILTKLMEVSRD